MILVKTDKAGRYIGYVDVPDNTCHLYFEEGYFEAPIPEGSAYIWNENSWEYSPDIEVLKAEVLLKRDRLLVNSDWTQLPDVPLATKEAWTIYRQQLRDISTQVGFPTQIEWPTKPS